MNAKAYSLGDLVRVDAVNFYQGIGLIVEVEEDEYEIVYRVLEKEGYLHYYTESELEMVDETR